MKWGHISRACLLALLALPFAGCANAWPMNTRPHTYAVAIEDFDNDGDRDLYLANGKNEGLAKDVVWFNNGRGVFDTYLTQSFEWETDYIAVGDLDGDGIRDAVTDAFTAMNDGQGRFAYSPIRFGSEQMGAYTTYPALGDLDGDHDLDLVLAGCCGGVAQFDTGRRQRMPTWTSVLLNNGAGGFEDSGQRLGSYGVNGAALGDLDGDGDLDLYLATSLSHQDASGEVERRQPDTVWWNDGQGRFTDSGQRLGRETSYAVALGDLDADGDLDAFTGTEIGCTLWWNDGSGLFAPGEAVLGSENTRSVTLADVDSDGDLDAYASGSGFGTVWINQDGAFQPGSRASYSIWAASMIGDIDGDRQVEIVAALLDEWVKVWENDGKGNFQEVWE